MQCKSGFTPDGRPFSITKGFKPGELWEDYKLLDEFSEAEQQQVLSWIREHITPRATENDSRTSYGLKHDFENDGGFYMTNNQFKDAMNQAGFLPVDETKLNWTYKISIKNTEGKKKMKVSDFRVSDFINTLKKADEKAAICLFVNEQYIPLEGIESRYYQHYEDQDNPCTIQINLKARRTDPAVRRYSLYDFIDRFLADATISEKNATISAHSLYSLYQNWAEDVEEAYILTYRCFWNIIRQSGYYPERKKYGWVWHGLKSIDD